MPLEVEKKYRLTKTQRDAVLRRLPAVGAIAAGEEFEENTLYGGEALATGPRVLRLRRIGNHALLTYKERLPSASSVKQQHEEETSVADPDAMASILEALGLRPVLVYEKRRMTWTLGEAEVVVDELPFGLFMEIEGAESEILDIERKLALKGLRAEHQTYPFLTRRHGKTRDGVIEARFLRKPTQGSKTRPKSKKKSGRAR
jgi:adenylate cyclase, class 2